MSIDRMHPLQRLGLHARSVMPAAVPMRSWRPYGPKRHYNFEGEPAFPTPWAWYRGDDLTGYSEAERTGTWTDRQGTRDVSDDGAGLTPQWTADAVGGLPGIVRSASEANSQHEAVYPAVPSDAVTIAVVTRVSGSGFGWVDVTGDAGQRLGRLSWSDGYQELEAGASISAAYSEQAMSGEHLVMAGHDLDEGRMWLDGVQVASTVNTFSQVSHYQVVVGLIAATVSAADVLIWDWLLSDAERGQVEAYAGRYGL